MKTHIRNMLERKIKKIKEKISLLQKHKAATRLTKKRNLISCEIKLLITLIRKIAWKRWKSVISLVFGIDVEE